ncbi:MAG: hypothetical protein HYY24_16865 [Verrucomicrobia bacterium]|nr:hypothetical protein [Verrucomicrobiota bacterium]
MALDEALLEAAPRLGRPLLRFYAWSEPAASFGYSQHYGDVARWTELRPLIRRPTGGGLVPHANDWTYSLVFPPGHSWYALPAVASYRRLHEWLYQAFARMRVATSLSPSPQKELPGRCFVGAEQFDLLCEGRKIAGAAQRRTRLGLLIQGSIQPPGRADRAAWQQAVRDVAAEEFRVRWEPWFPSPALLARVRELAEQKYSQAAYTEKR